MYKYIWASKNQVGPPDFSGLLKKNANVAACCVNVCKTTTCIRIDNRRQSLIRDTLHYTLALSFTIPYHIPNDSFKAYIPLRRKTTDVGYFCVT